MTFSKTELRKQFAKQWKKHYNLKILGKHGFERKKCSICGKHFWTTNPDNQTCGDSACAGYGFISNPSGKSHTYIQSWKEIARYFTSKKHKQLYTYPCVARWRDDLYFTIASIADFQPYVVKGEVEPPANPLIIPQVSIRFADLSNVGVSGRHMTNFVMVGQHAFNTKKLFYWKEQAIEHDINMLLKFGIKINEITFVEDVWAGGGNFGPSMEFFVKGMELGNCVFMQYEFTDKGIKELKTKVIDMGAGLERFAWVTQGTPTVYDATYPSVIKKLQKSAGLKTDTGFMLNYWKHCGKLDVEQGNIEQQKKKIAQKLGLDNKELFAKVKPVQAMYAAADHLKTILLTATDGMLPGNSGGGYNLRMILRRTFGFNELYNLNIDYNKIIDLHAQEVRDMFPHYTEGIATAHAVIDEELKKYKNTKHKTRGKLSNIIRHQNKIDTKTLVKLYESDGIPPEIVAEEAKLAGAEIQIPDNFYDLIKSKQLGEKERQKHATFLDKPNYPATKKIYYTEKKECIAKVLGIENIGKGSKGIILDRTVFYPESGGQAGDTGYLNLIKKAKNILVKKIRITGTEKIGNIIVHVTGGKPGIRKRDKVKVVYDYEKRMAITRNHTGAHIINAASRKVLGAHVWQAGAYKNDKKAHLDITHYKRITHAQANEIETEANKIVMQNHNITVDEMSRTKAEKKYGMRIYQGGAVPGKKLRIITINNIDSQACGGTHHMLKKTGELGLIKIVRTTGIQDGVERIEFVCGVPAIKYVQDKQKVLREIKQVFGVQDKFVVATVNRFFEEWKQRGKEIKKLREQVAIAQTGNISTKNIIVNVDYDRSIMMKIASELLKQNKPLCMINKNNDVVCSAPTENDRKIIMCKLNEIGFTGGGRKIINGKIKKKRPTQR